MSEFTYRGSANVSFIVKNNSNKKIRIFNYPLLPGQTRDLLQIPRVGEEDIRASLLKGQLQFMLSIGQVTIVSSDIDLLQYNLAQQSFLHNSGATVGLAEFSSFVANAAALTALDDTSLPDNCERRVTTYRDVFVLNKTSTDALIANQTLATKSGTGRWQRRGKTQQTVIHYDAINGNDENDGLTSGTSIKSMGRILDMLEYGSFLCRDVVIQLHSNVVDNFSLSISSLYPSQVTFQGTQTQLFTGTITTYTAYNSSTKVQGSIASNSIPTSWTASGGLQKLIVLTSGTNSGAYGWTIADSGSKTALVGPFFDPNSFSAISPANGDTFAVYDVTQWIGDNSVFAQWIIGSCGSAFTYFQDIFFNNTGIFSQMNAGATCIFKRCKFAVFGLDVEQSAYSQMYGCYHSGGRYRSFASSGNVYATSCVFDGCSVRCESNGYMTFTDLCVFQNGAVLRLLGGGTAQIQSTTAAFFNINNGTAPIICLRGSNIILDGLCYGAGNTCSYVIYQEAGSSVICNTLTQVPDINVVTAYAYICGVTKTRAEMLTRSFLNIANGAFFASAASGDSAPANPSVFGEVTVDQSLAANSFTDIPGLTATLTTSADFLLIVLTVNASTLVGVVDIQLVIDGVAKRGGRLPAATSGSVSISYRFATSAGSHTIKGQYKAAAGATLQIRPATHIEESGSVLVMESL